MRQIENYQNNILTRTRNFAKEIIKLSTLLPKNPAGFTLSDQIVRSGCSIGANLTEAQEASSGNDFLYKISISLKEAKETRYWLNLINDSNLVPTENIKLLLNEIEEIIRILVATVIKLKSKK